MKCFVYNRTKMTTARNSALEDMRKFRKNKGYLDRDLIRIFIANNLNRLFGTERWDSNVVDNILCDMLYNCDIIYNNDVDDDYYVCSP